MKKNRIIPIILFALFLVSCGTPAVNNNYITPQQVSEPKIAEITPTFEIQIERVNNCDGTNATYNVSYKTVETQRASFEVTVGAGGLVTGTPIPSVLEVQLEAKITAALAKDYGLTTEKDHDIRLDNPQGTFLEHKIEWKVTRVRGLMEVIYGDGVAQVVFDKIANVELYNRTSKPLGCDGNSVSVLPTSTDDGIIPLVTVETDVPPTVSRINKIEYTFSVSANEPWQFTGVEIQSGDYLTIEYASGEWTGQLSVGGLSGPDYGAEPRNTNSCFPIPGEGSSLIGKIGTGQAFKVGYQYFDTENSGGKLYLRMNDCDNMLSDNKGSITAKITIER